MSAEDSPQVGRVGGRSSSVSASSPYAMCGDDSLISQFSSGSMYNSPVRSPSGERQSWMTTEVTAETRLVNGIHVSPPDFSHPSLRRSLKMLTAADDSIDDELVFPVQLVPRILCVGAACLDVLLSVAHFPEENQKMRAEQTVISGGGNAANTAGVRADIMSHPIAYC